MPRLIRPLKKKKYRKNYIVAGKVKSMTKKLVCILEN